MLDSVEAKEQREPDPHVLVYVRNGSAARDARIDRVKHSEPTEVPPFGIEPKPPTFQAGAQTTYAKVGKRRSYTKCERLRLHCQCIQLS